MDEQGQRTSEFEFNDRGRGPKLVERITLDAAGLPLAIEVDGNSYMGAPVQEDYSRVEGAAKWNSTLDRGERTTTSPSFYAAAEGTPDQLALLARALLRAPGQRLPLLPAGEARIEVLLSHEFTTGGEKQRATLHAISGLGFTPEFIWLDEDEDLFALSYGWMGLAREGRGEVLEEIRRLQDQAEDTLLRQRATELTQRMPARWCLSDARWLDVDTGKLNPAANLLIADGVIEAVGAPADVDCSGLPQIPAAGRIVLPGLWDMHVHAGASDGLLHIANGVTGARDLANDHEQLMKVAASFASGELVGPRLQRSGFIDKKSPYTAPTGAPVDTLEQALAQIDQYAAQGYPQVKIYSSIPPEWVAPMAARIHGHGMRLSGHIPAFMSAEQAVRQGFDEIQHVNMLFLNFVSDADTDSRTPQRFLKVAEKGGDLDLDSAEVRDFIALLKQRDIVVDPTVSIFDEMFRHRSGEVSPVLASVADHLPPQVQRSARAGSLDINEGNAARYAASAEALLGMIRRLHEAGVRLVPGTDSIVGFTLHRELELYVQAGIPNAEVIRLATSSAADIANTGVKVGRIAPGQAADLLVVDGDPLQDIAALRRGVLVVRGDRVFRPDAIYRSLGIKPFVESIP
ncbi:amidohydrolase family protein [Arenimonas daejeonensis]|uniref:amidohydrolase family protein n=1 Tax=Arenimonas daejeonensis TaxID=370777 RepID=UPI0011BFDBB1|nr:amidohydrolase family protein [Arenimonas daejeonensis]